VIQASAKMNILLVASKNMSSIALIKKIEGKKWMKKKEKNCFQ